MPESLDFLPVEINGPLRTFVYVVILLHFLALVRRAALPMSHSVRGVVHARKGSPWSHCISLYIGIAISLAGILDAEMCR